MLATVGASAVSEGVAAGGGQFQFGLRPTPGRDEMSDHGDAWFKSSSLGKFRNADDGLSSGLCDIER